MCRIATQRTIAMGVSIKVESCLQVKLTLEPEMYKDINK